MEDQERGVESIKQLFMKTLEQLDKKGITDPFLDKVKTYVTKESQDKDPITQITEYLKDVMNSDIIITDIQTAKVAFLKTIQRLADHVDQLTEDKVLTKQDAHYFALQWQRLWDEPFDTTFFFTRLKLLILQLKSYV
jgi:hypothetical protein